MVEKVIKYEKTGGTKCEVKYSSKVRTIDLYDESIKTIDLSPLSSFKDLRKLNLGYNDLERVDLSALSSCTRLEEFYLSSRNLKDVDISPLATCARLKKIYLSLDYHFPNKVDLSALRSCTELESLELAGIGGEGIEDPLNLPAISSLTNLRYFGIFESQINAIDISPLSSSVQLEELFIYGTQLEQIDLTSLSACKRLKVLNLGLNKLVELDLSEIESCSKLEDLCLGTGEMADEPPGNYLKSLDLSPLVNCKGLKNLELDGNQLEELDLRPLSHCVDLEYLYLQHNKLKRLDLEPLAECKNLKSLILRDNELSCLDMSPLSSCDELGSFDISCNKLKTLDLSPLAQCTELGFLSVAANEIRDLELAPLAFCRDLTYFYMGQDERKVGFTLLSLETMYDELHVPHDVGWWVERSEIPYAYTSLNLIAWLSTIIHKYEPHTWKLAHLVKCLTDIVCPEEIGFLDFHFATFESIVKESDPTVIRDRVVEAFCRQIDKGGTTIGIDVDRIASSSYEELARRLPRVIELRKAELNGFGGRIKKYDNKVDLRQIWLTAYGYQFLSTLGLGLECSVDDYQLVREGLEDIGFSISITASGEDSEVSTDISKSLQEYIWFLAEYEEEDRNKFEIDPMISLLFPHLDPNNYDLE